MRKMLFLFCLILLTHGLKSQQLAAGNFTSYQINGAVLKILTNQGTVTIRAFTNNILQVNYFPDNIETYDSSSVVTLNPAGSMNMTEDSGHLFVFTGTTDLVISKFPVRISLTDNGKIKFTEASGIYQRGQQWGADFATAGNAFYGTGTRALPVNLQGDSFYMYNTAIYSYEFGQPVMNINIPFLVSNNMFGIYFENNSPGTMNIQHGDSLVRYLSDTLRLSYYIINGSSYDSIIAAYTQLTGRQPMPPRWITGYIQSKFGYHSEQDARAIVDLMHKQKFPMDALVLDLYWYGQFSAMGNLDWDHSNWPDPVQMMSDFKNQGVKTVLITEPYFTNSSLNFSAFNSAGYFAKKPDGTTYILPGFWTGPAALLDIYNGDAQTSFWKTYQKHTDEGVGGWWCDLGEPESHPTDMMHVNGPANLVHNIYSFEWAKILSDHFTKDYPSRRLFHLFRSGYAGAQRWGLIPWSGDVKKSWSGLQAQIPIMLNSGMSGLAYMHGDAGGFDGSDMDELLYTRWLQFAAFTPVMRAHGYEAVPTEPVYYSKATQDIVRNFINLRYSLLPYTYTMMYENARMGRPLARPMFYDEPANASTANIFNQYYWGKNMIVAPVTDPAASNTLVYAPAGKWYDYFSRQWIDGGSTSKIGTPIENLALLIRGNSFIPFLKPKMSTDFMGMDSLYITYFNSNQALASSDIIYEDDTAARDPLSTNRFSIISLASQGFQPTDNLEILLKDSVSNDWPGKKSLHFMEFTVTDMRKNYNVVTVNGIKLNLVYSLQSFNARDSVFYYDFANQKLLLHFSWQETSSALIRISYDATLPTGPKNIFPNPTTGDLYVPLELTTAGQYQFSLIDMQGRTLGTLATMNLSAGFTNVYLLLPSTLSTGSYLVYITGDNYNKVEQVIKK